MKQAKWLLLIAVGIFVMLPGCKQLNPVVNPDVNIAATEPIGTFPLLMGGNTPQPQVGTVSLYWQYDYYDASKTGNDAFINLQLGITFVTTNPTYVINGDAHVNIGTNQPTGKGAPGQYNMFRDTLNNNACYQQPYTDNFTRIYLIPVAVLEQYGWTCGGSLWFLCEVSLFNGQTAMVGTFHHPRGQAWWNDINLQIKNPTPPDNPPPGSWPGQTLTWGWWQNPFTGGPNPQPKHPNYYDPVYLPQQIAPWHDNSIHDGWINTPPDAAYIFSKVGGGGGGGATPDNYWDIFQAQFLAARLNAHWQNGVIPSLDNAYYDWPGLTGEPCENWKVADIFTEALTANQGMDAGTLSAMTTILDRINSYGDKHNGCLWIGPNGPAGPAPW